MPLSVRMPSHMLLCCSLSRVLHLGLSAVAMLVVESLTLVLTSLLSVLESSVGIAPTPEYHALLASLLDLVGGQFWTSTTLGTASNIAFRNLTQPHTFLDLRANLGNFV